MENLKSFKSLLSYMSCYPIRFQEFFFFFGFQQFDYDVSRNISIWFFCLGSDELLKFINVCLLLNLWKFSSLFLQVHFVYLLFSAFIPGLPKTHVIPFVIVPQIPKDLFKFHYSFSLLLRLYIFYWSIYLQVHWLFLLSSPLYYWIHLISDIVVFSSRRSIWLHFTSYTSLLRT